ncbi:MAG: FG-GAP-like repeat-containing protein, partial [Nitrospirota bacterium]|nr:FG-GAP-like repeat-containing protein [Nitrospirota bacterium]
EIRQEVLVSDERNYRIQIFDFDGTYKAFFGKYTKEKVFGSLLPSDFQGKFSSISGLTVDKEGRIYVADTFQCNIQVLDRDGNFLTFISTYGMGDGQLNSPLDVTIDNSRRLVITDRNNNRLALFLTDSGPAINNMAPETPVQVSPANAVQVGGSLTPSLTVYNSNDPNGDLLNYRFEIDTSSSFTSPMAVVAASGSTYTSATSPVLTDHTVYFWRVRAEEAATVDMLTSGWSGTRTFYLNAVNRAPSAPSGLMPAAGSTVNKSTSLSWTASTDPDLYDTLTYSVEISESVGFGTVIVNEAGLGNNSIRISNMAQYTVLKSGTTYYWRLRAIDNHGASSSYSATGSFVFQKTLIEITSDPAGAKVYLDGNYAYPGTYAGVTSGTPLEIANIQPGRHVVRVEKEGYYSYYTSVLLTVGETERVDADLVAKAGGTIPFTRQLTDENGTVIGDGLPPLASVKPFMVDWNNDGVKDLLVGDDAGRVYVYENVSTDSAPVYRISGDYVDGVPLAVAGKAAPFAVDWNNDGKKDLVVGLNDGTVRLYVNLGSEELPTFGVSFDLTANGSVIQVSGNATPFVADWNNDSKKDLLVGESNGMARLYLNSGSDDVPAFDDYGLVVQGARVQAGGVDMNVAADAVPYVTDWNHDGKKDLLVGAGTGLWVFLNSGTDAAPVLDSSATAYLTGTGLSPFVLDYNNDGYSDLLIGNSDGNINYYQFKQDAPAPGTPTVKKEKKKEKGVKKLFKKFKFW